MKSLLIALGTTLLLTACGDKIYTAQSQTTGGTAQGKLTLRGDEVEIKVTFPQDAEALEIKGKREKTEQGFYVGEGRQRYYFYTVFLGKKNDEALACDLCSFNKGDKGVLLETWRPAS